MQLLHGFMQQDVLNRKIVQQHVAGVDGGPKTISSKKIIEKSFKIALKN